MLALVKSPLTKLVLVGSLVVLSQEGMVQLLLSVLPGLDGIVKSLVAAQVAALALEADGRSPAPLPFPPLHPRHAAGVVAPHGAGPDHLHTGAVHESQAGPPGPAGGGIDPGPVAAAGCPAVPAQVSGDRDDFPPAVASAQPRGMASDIFSGSQYRKFSEPLAGQIQLFSRMACHFQNPLVDKIFILSQGCTFLGNCNENQNKKGHENQGLQKNGICSPRISMLFSVIR